MTPQISALLSQALEAPYGIGVQSANPSGLITLLSVALREVAHAPTDRALCARMGSTPSEVWIVRQAQLPAKRITDEN